MLKDGLKFKAVKTLFGNGLPYFSVILWITTLSFSLEKLVVRFYYDDNTNNTIGLDYTRVKPY